MLLRKALSLFRLLRESSSPWHDLLARLRENWFTLTRRQPFRYEAAPGFPFACVPAAASSRYIFLKDYQEQLEARAVAAWLLPGDACIDVGANVGYFACLFAAKVGRAGRVLALEPGARTFAFLRETVDLVGLPEVSLKNVCALDSERSVRFMVAASDATESEQSLRVADARRGEFQEVEVPGTTLDALVCQHEIAGRVSLVKIDVEGAEPLVLRGAASLLAAEVLPFFVVEIHRLALANFQFTPADILAFFPAEQFRRLIVPRSTSDATPARPYGQPRAYSEGDELPVLCNLLALPLTGRFAERAKALASLLP
jgi:FkbM family methyltransferase